MESQRLDIIDLIERNPITNLSSNYQSKFLQKVQEQFTDTQQKLFVSSFYCYLNYNNTDFVIDMSDIWKWLGFTRKENCKVVLEKHFHENSNYKIIKKSYEKKAATEVTVEANLVKNLGGAGYNKEKILMTTITFKKLCLKAGTKKADEIHDYFIKLEQLGQETLMEEAIGLKLQLENQQTKFIKDTQQILLDSYNNKSIVYLIKIIIHNIILYKFGYTDNIKRRVNEHQTEINTDIKLIFCIESKNNRLLEIKFKEYLKKINCRKTQTINNKVQTELIETDDISIIEIQLSNLNKDITEDLELLKTKQHILELEIELASLKLKQFNLNEIDELKQDKNDNYNEIINNQKNKIEELNQDELKQNDNENQDDDELELETQTVLNINTNTQDALNIKKLKLEEILKKTRENSRKRVEKFRSTEKYRLYINTDKFKEKEKLRNDIRTKTIENINYRKEYYQINKKKIDAQKLEIKRKKSKTTFVNTDAEKNKFKTWLSLNVNQKIKGNLIWSELLDKYLGYRTNCTISSTYKMYFNDYCREIHTGIECKYLQFRLNGKNPHGYRNFQLILP